MFSHGDPQQSSLLCIRARLQSCRKGPEESGALAPATVTSERNSNGKKQQGLKSLRENCRIWGVRGAHCRSLHYAPPDFLLTLVALVHFMRPSLRKGAHAALSVLRGRKSGYAPVGMTKGKASLPFASDRSDGQGGTFHPHRNFTPTNKPSLCHPDRSVA
jgi:hypothetical protein